MGVTTQHHTGETLVMLLYWLKMHCTILKKKLNKKNTAPDWEHPVMYHTRINFL